MKIVPCELCNFIFNLRIPNEMKINNIIKTYYPFSTSPYIGMSMGRVCVGYYSTHSHIDGLEKLQYSSLNTCGRQLYTCNRTICRTIWVPKYSINWKLSNHFKFITKLTKINTYIKMHNNLIVMYFFKVTLTFCPMMI